MVRYAMLRVHRRPLPADQLAKLQKNCDNLSDAILQLYTQTSTKDGSAVLTLRATQPLSEADFSEEEWVEFFDLTDVYRDLVNSLHDRMKITDNLHVRLAVKSLSCPSLSPSDLGFGSVSENRAQLVGFEENSVQNDLLFPKVISHFAKKQAQHARSRRQAGLALVTEAPPKDGQATPVLPTGVPTPPHTEHYVLTRCQLYQHEVWAILNYQLCKLWLE